MRGLEEVISGFKKKTQEITGKNEKTEKNSNARTVRWWTRYPDKAIYIGTFIFQRAS